MAADALDNVFIERLWRRLKYEPIYPGAFATGLDLFAALENYSRFYNHRRPHQALGYHTPSDLFTWGNSSRDHNRCKVAANLWSSRKTSFSLVKCT
jgi:transposase InsO family protein